MPHKLAIVFAAALLLPLQSAYSGPSAGAPSHTASAAAQARSGNALDFNRFAQSYGQPLVSVSLNKSVLGLVGTVAGLEDAALGSAIAAINGIDVRVFDLAGKPQPASALVDTWVQNSGTAGWAPLATVRDGDQNVQVYANLRGEVMDGLMVAALDFAGQGEAVLVHIDGHIDLAHLAQIVQTVSADSPKVHAALASATAGY